MSIERVYFCDWRGCENHAQTDGSSAPASYLTVSQGEAVEPEHFCSWDCLLKFAAETPPAEVVQLGDA
jgi:hypothetical protein